MDTNCDCTVFNRVYDKEGREYLWQGTVVHGVYWQGGQGVRLMKNGLKEDKETTVFIPMFAESQRTYAKPVAFGTGEGGTTFTFRPEDRLVRGVVLDRISQKELFSRFDDAITITAVDTFDQGGGEMNHWEVRGR